MKVLVVGATGYVGSVVAERLAEQGHQVVALVRPGRDRPLPSHVTSHVTSQVTSQVTQVRIGDLSAPGSLGAAVTADVDAVVHAGAPTGDARTDAAATDALLAPLRGTGRAFLYLSGVWVLGATGDAVADESAPTHPVDLVRDRPAVERLVLAAAADGVRALVVRPGVVHGRGGGIPALLVRLAAEHGSGRYVGAPARWPMVHVDDLADLLVRALDGAPTGSLLHAVSQQAVPVVELARAASVAAGVTTGAEEWPLAQARAALGAAFADALALDQAVGGDRARRELGWRPRRPGAVEDLARGSYAAAAAA